VLYLAEVQKKTSFISGTKSELKLLACQQTDQSWSAVPGDEAIAAPDEANSYNAGVLVLVDLGQNRQVQRPIQEAGRELVKILQNFSRLLQKSKKDEEEIEQWKQSLTYQSQELNRREMEMEAKVEQLQQIEEDLERLEQQRQEINNSREEVKRLKQEFERNRQQLEGAWEHLRGEQRRLEERQGEVSSTTGLDAQQAGWIQELLNRISGAIAPADTLREQLNLAFEVVNTQQATLDYHWQQLQQQQASAEQMQAEVDYQTQELQNRSTALHEAQASLEDAQTELKVQQQALDMKQESAHKLRLHLQTSEDLYQQIYRMATGSGDDKGSPKFDIEALEKMPLGELQEIVQNLQNDLEKLVRFVNDQEEELTEKRQTIEELQARIQQASEYDRLSLENELAEEQDGYQMLDNTLQPQRLSLREREEIFNQHMRLLRRRQGLGESGTSDDQKIDFEPILSQIEAQRQQQEEDLQKLESQIEQMRSSIQQAQGLIDHQVSEQQTQRHDLQAMEQNLQHQLATIAQLWGKVNLYQETLPPMQDSLTGVRQNLEQLAGIFDQIQESGDYQLQAISEMWQTINSLIETPQQLAAS
jgi:chromosome segregation ATPase